MARQNKNRGASQQEKPALELTSYQLVMTICALLLLMCVMFIAGIMVDRITNGGPAVQTAARIDTTETSRPGRTDSATQPIKKTEGTQETPKPVQLPPPSAKSSSSKVSSSSTGSGDGGAKYIPAPPPRRDAFTPSPAQTEEKSATEQAKEAPATVTVVRPGEATAAAAPEAPQKTDIAKKEEPARTGSATTTPSSPPTASAPAPSPARAASKDTATIKGPYTIQVGSFDADNMERVKEFKESVEEKTDFRVVLVPSEDGKLIRAYVGDYKDRAEADKAREAMRKLDEFKDCFVKSLAE